MKAKLILNEIRQSSKRSGLSALGVGRTSIINVPSLFKSLEKTWSNDDFMWPNENNPEMKSSYTENGKIYTIEFDYSEIKLPKDRIENPKIVYDDENFSINVFFGGVKDYKGNNVYQGNLYLNLYNEDDRNRAKEMLEADGWPDAFFQNLDTYIKEYGSNAEEARDEYEEPYDDRLGGGGLYY